MEVAKFALERGCQLQWIFERHVVRLCGVHRPTNLTTLSAHLIDYWAPSGSREIMPMVWFDATWSCWKALANAWPSAAKETEIVVVSVWLCTWCSVTPGGACIAHNRDVLQAARLCGILRAKAFKLDFEGIPGFGADLSFTLEPSKQQHKPSGACVH